MAGLEIERIHLTGSAAHPEQNAGPFALWIACCVGSNLELGVGTAAMLQIAAVDPSIDSVRYPGDLIGPLYHEADLLTAPLNLGPEVARVPDGPGLGVELDEEQLARYRVC